jgi:hypothetical protein
MEKELSRSYGVQTMKRLDIGYDATQSTNNPEKLRRPSATLWRGSRGSAGEV